PPFESGRLRPPRRLLSPAPCQISVWLGGPFRFSRRRGLGCDGRRLRLERRLVDRQGARVRVDRGADSERQRPEILAVSEREVEEDRDAERLELMLEDVLHRAAAQPRVL